MVTPLVTVSGQTFGFTAGELVYDARDRRLGMRRDMLVVNDRGLTVARIDGSVLHWPSVLRRPIVRLRRTVVS